MRFFVRALLCGVFALLPLGALPCGALAAKPAVANTPIEIRVVVVTAFEIGEDLDDKAGEYQAWARVMPRILAFPAGFRHLRYDPASHVLLLSTGIGTNRAAASVMALGLDPRFDLSHAYWLVAAIAGANPDTTSVGSAAWIGDVIDTDYGYAIDPREVPPGWPTGMFPRDRKAPYQAPRGDTRYNLFALDKPLRDWAYGLTRHIVIPDVPALQAVRGRYAAYPVAQTPPIVMTGDEASGQTFWHGAMLNTHVEKWVDYWTGGSGRFVVTAMEDSGVAGSLTMLGRIGRADPDRLLVLRTASNYTLPPAGMDAATSLAAESGGLSALQPSLHAAFLIGSPVVAALSGNWPLYRNHIPGRQAGKAPVTPPR